MYLIKAECQLYTENGNAAMSTINELRKVRAKSGKDNTLSGAATLETVLEERAIELCGEQQRWFDLKRTHKLVDHVTKYNAQASSQIKEMIIIVQYLSRKLTQLLIFLLLKDKVSGRIVVINHI
jgi:hypothetical protein